jgi:hypothetical protein
MKSIKTIKARYDNLHAKFQKGMDELRLDTMEFMAPYVQPLFEKYPKLNAVAWPQYTPYFNDGDKCEFQVHEPQIAWGDDEIQYPDDISWGDDSDLPDDIESELENALSCLPNHMKKAIFGDHVMVAFRRDKTALPNLSLTFHVEEYDHD